jgi:hypothetical protein
MSEVMTAPQPVVPVTRKCVFEEVFDANFIELIGLAPRNPHVRALILKLTGKLPPTECATFAQLKEWVELNCEKRAKPLPSAAGRNSRDGGIVVNVDFSETEYGRASYSVRRHGSESFRIGADDLMEMVQSAIDDGDGLDKVVEAVADKVDSDAWGECDPSLDDSGDYNYSEHDVSDTGDSETSCDRAEIRRAVLAFVRERHPELAAEL